MGPVMLDKTVKSWYDVTSFTNPFLNKLVKNDKTSSPPSGKLQVCMERRSRMRLFLLCNLSNFKTAWTIIWEKKWSAIEPVFSGTVSNGRFSKSSTCTEGSLKADHSNKLRIICQCIFIHVYLRNQCQKYLWASILYIKSIMA